tara:strand:+ start:8097 stop:8252 length:156 start_codon:yes stop_codon:yes gene_type:complete
VKHNTIISISAEKTQKIRFILEMVGTELMLAAGKRSDEPLPGSLGRKTGKV